ncbi:hypothetical protein F5B20DRAFT_172322 [Whalleya microplaca]|nr:hypothetical protein F5B20DRAFT_172322 [Whalleya microplaca]
MATRTSHRQHVTPPINPWALSNTFSSQPSQYRRQHESYSHSTMSSSQDSDMTTANRATTLSQVMTRGIGDWTDSDASSSTTSGTSHARFARQPHFPPVLPSVNSSGSISKSLPQKLAATISAVESSHRRQNSSKSLSPSNRFRRLEPPPLPPQPQRQRGSILSNALRGSQNPSSRSHALPSRPTQPVPYGVHETMASQEETSDSEEDLVLNPRVWTGSGQKQKGMREEDEGGSESGSFDLEDEEESDDSDSDSDSDVFSRVPPGFQRLAGRYSKLRDRRAVLWEVFDGIRLKRTQVQDLRHSRDQANLTFMTAVQAILPNSPGLDRLFKAMQDAQLRCQEAEQRFDDMLGELEHGEVELELEERRFYTAAAGIDSAAASDDGSDDDSCSQTSDNSALRGITGDRPEDIHPLFQELRETFANIQLAKELLANTRLKRKALSITKFQFLAPDSIELLENFGDVGKKRALELRQSGILSEDDVELLQDYDELEQQAISDIDRYTEVAIQLEKECHEKGVMPKNTPFRQEGFGFNPVHQDDIHLGAEPPGRHFSGTYPKTLAHPVFPTLLSNPMHLLEDFPRTPEQSLRMAISLPPGTPHRQKHIDTAAREVNINSLFGETKEEDKNGFINRWLLHKLHSSPMEAELLWCTFHVRLKILNVDRWQQDVLYLWWQDQAANIPPAQFQGIYEDRSSASINPRTDIPSKCHSDSAQVDYRKSLDPEEADAQSTTCSL